VTGRCFWPAAARSRLSTCRAVTHLGAWSQALFAEWIRSQLCVLDTPITAPCALGPLCRLLWWKGFELEVWQWQCSRCTRHDFSHRPLVCAWLACGPVALMWGLCVDGLLYATPVAPQHRSLVAWLFIAPVNAVVDGWQPADLRRSRPRLSASGE